MSFSQDLRELLTCMSLVAAVGYITDLQLYAGVCVAIQWLSAIYGIPNQTERYFDLTGSTTYATVSMLAYLQSESMSWRDTLLTAFVWLWCVRLGSFLYWRICQCGSDKRFAEIIVNPLCFLAAWNIQGLWVFFTLLSVLLSVTHGVDDPEVKPLDIIGTSLWIVGYIIEVTADYQKTQFRLDKRNDGQFIRTGLWKYSRHPNYFGEIMMWIGVFLVAVHTLPSFALQCGAAVSPTFMTLLIIFRSGIPLLEEAADERWGKLKTYQNYKAQTSVLVPMPQRKLPEPKRAKIA
ncbi:Putative 5 alpha steroid reductase [Phytophthora palmivora]|uniref:5 alpha steroid reductase n=1 Tax=Phytophthora palmivora TaxID=4796 RepID=A0A2P4WWX6_9STRA|nr:Putative 5 alpha steroid reductase [Phytophthora palmivora]